jgi:hypothetical protein
MGVSYHQDRYGKSENIVRLLKMANKSMASTAGTWEAWWSQPS